MAGVPHGPANHDETALLKCVLLKRQWVGRRVTVIKFED